MSTTDPSVTYATPLHRPVSPWVRSAVLMFGGLSLIVLGGCFLIGVLLLLRPQLALGPTTPAAWTARHDILMVILYACAGACFVGAILLISKSLLGLAK